MTPGFRKALEFIRDNKDCSPRELAEHLWPNAIMHRKPYNCGNHNGSANGTGAWLCAGSLVGKLKRKNWVDDMYVGKGSGTRIRYRITQAGREALEGKYE